MKYLVISRGQDNPHIEIVAKETLEKALAAEWADKEFLSSEPDLEYMPADSLFIFKGEVVIPKPVQTVTRYVL